MQNIGDEKIFEWKYLYHFRYENSIHKSWNWNIIGSRKTPNGSFQTTN